MRKALQVAQREHQKAQQLACTYKAEVDRLKAVEEARNEGMKDLWSIVAERNVTVKAKIDEISKLKDELEEARATADKSTLSGEDISGEDISGEDISGEDTGVETKPYDDLPFQVKLSRAVNFAFATSGGAPPCMNSLPVGALARRMYKAMVFHGLKLEEAELAKILAETPLPDHLMYDSKTNAVVLASSC